MADEKVTFKISADTKEAQKELEALQKDLKDVVNITDETQKKLDALHGQRGVKPQRDALKAQLNDLKDYREEIERNIKVAKKRVATELSVDKAMARMEKRQQEDEDRELRWALAQFDYKSKTADESKAWAIICKRLGVKR